MSISFLLLLLTSFYRLGGKTTQIYYLSVLEVRSLKYTSRAVLLLDALGENPYPCLFQLLEAACIP